ncbi:MAG: hypothetical protein AMXMBFR13_26420 [Phycisphaerae bacterium]
MLKEVRKAEGQPAGKHYFEIWTESIVTCGIKRRVVCPYCGYRDHDLRDFEADRPIRDWGGTDFFWIDGLGRPVCTSRPIELLNVLGNSAFDVRTVREVLDDF